MPSVKNILFPQDNFNYAPPYDTNSQLTEDLTLLGGVFQDTNYVWQAKGPVLEVRNTKSGCKVGGWIFGGILKDSNTKIVCVEEIQRPNGRISLLVIGIECTISGGIICIFDVFNSKVIRAIQINEKISSLHVVDPGIEDLNLPGPLRNFDGILAVGTEGGDVFLLDICRQICEESLHCPSKKDELDPSQVVLLTAKHISKIEHYKERSVREGKHLGIHLNAVLENTTDHFVLKGPTGDDRIHVNKEEVITSAVYYCAQLTSLLIGYNFGAFQLWNLTSLQLVYTSPVCDEHIPITHFALQEPTDDPRAFCYIWVSYSNAAAFQTGLPFAVMYALCYESKEYHEGYGYLYQDFHYCNIRFQMELGHIEEHRGVTSPKGGHCIGIQPLTKHSAGKDSFPPTNAGDTLALCLVTWTVWFSKSDTQTCYLIFDLNQWYKEQMPGFSKWSDCNNFILRSSLSESILFNGLKKGAVSKVLLDEKSLTQFVGVQKLEEHFFPTSFSFNLWILREGDVVLMPSQGLQKSLLAQIECAGPLCLVRPADVCRQALTIGLTPLFVDILPSRALSIESQREIVLNVALEHQLIGWLCKCASEWADGSFSSAGCSLDFLVAWAFQRAVVLKNNCDEYCAPLFDYSQSKLDANTSVLLNSCTQQLSGLCVLYKHVAEKLRGHVNCMDVIDEHWTRLEMVSRYFEVLQWLVNVGLLPECHPSTYPRPDNSERISAPYPVQELTEYYREKRAELCMLSQESFKSSESLLFIDNLVNRKCGGSKLLNLWQEDGGSGLYPPPSLQSLVRTYLVDGAGISHKHSLVIYLFLDLAMALDQSRYSSVVTHLIKFPAVFKVSPSLIKITQAFWQLDHGDFATAMDQLLDPFVLGEDLQPWHHTIAMRSLLINKQPNFALLYMKIRKPPITDEKDVLTAISLFVANKMLDEAFYFAKQHRNNDADKLLTHLFQECSKNDALHLVLYKCLNTDEEKTFFEYLKFVRNPTTEDLQIFYYLLRSRFVEAFDTHSDIRRKGRDRQGLIGQSQATKTDQIVKIFKTLLPEVNKNLVDYIRKEKNHLWKEVQRPTPMSVFVHNTREQVQYKSTLIHAALAKAKHTFPNSFAEKLVTEETPFLRTPTVCKNGKRSTNPIITPKIIDDNDTDDNPVPSPSKRMRLSPRLSAAELNSPLKTNARQITRMSIVKRKLSLPHDYTPQNVSNVSSLCTPQSILKVRKLVQNRDSITEDTFADETGDFQARSDSLLHSTSLRLQPRASISQPPKHQHVQFDAATRFSSSLSDQSGNRLDTTSPDDLNNLRSSLSSKDISAATSIGDDGELSDEVFFSPDNSDNLSKVTENVVTTPSVHEIKEVPKAVENREDIKQPDVEVVATSPRGRRSYKRSLGDSSPVRSSPRLSKLQSNKSEDEEKPTTSDDSAISDSPKPKPTPKIKGRKSLSRQVLEHNTFSKRFDVPLKESPAAREVSFTKSEKITVTERSPEKSKETVVESNIRIIDKDSPTTKTHSVSGSVTKKHYLECTMSSDSSVSCFEYDGPDESELSESLQEYIDEVLEGNKKNSDLSKKKLDFEEVEPVRQEEGPAALTEEEPLQSDRIEENELDFEEDKPVRQEEDEPVWQGEDGPVRQEEIEPVRQEEGPAALIKEDPLQSDRIREENEIADAVQIVPEEINTVTDADPLSECVIAEPVDESVFATLTPVQPRENQNVPPFQDDTELPSKDVYEDIYDVNEDYSELSEKEEERTYNELEMNIFGLEERSRRDTGYSVGDSFDVPDMEKAFIADKDDDVVVIISDDEKNSSSDRSGSSSSESEDHSGYSDTTEENEVDVDVDEEKSPFDEGELVLNEAVRESGTAEADPLETGSEKIKDTETVTEEDVKKSAGTEDVNTEETKTSGDREREIEPSKRKIPDTEVKEVNTSERKTSGDSEREEVAPSKPKIPDTEIKKVNTSKRITSEDRVIEEVAPSKPKIPETEEIETSKKKVVKKIEDRPTETNTDAATETEVVETRNQRTKSDISAAATEEPTVNEVDAVNLFESVITDTDTVAVVEDTGAVIESIVERLPKRKTYPSRGKKRFVEDHTTSSSDTTEGETFRKEVVTVQVHASDKEQPPAKMRTRQDDAPARSTDVDVKSAAKVEDVKKEPVLAKRTRRSLSASDTPARTAPVRPSGKIDCDPNSSYKLIDDGSNLAVKLTLRTKRSASVDEVRTFPRQAALKRNKSQDTVADESVKKATSAKHMPAISEEAPTSAVNTYTSARRLTRRQANMIKDATSASVESDRSKIKLDVDDIDPIGLLELGAFEGQPDPDENKVYEPSSPSTSARSLPRTRRRSGSVATEMSTSPARSVTRRGGRATRSRTKSPISTGVATRSKKHSETSSVVSEDSETSTPPKSTRKKKFEDGIESPSMARSTRSRTASISSDKSGLSNSSKTVVRARRAAKFDLPEIVEEKVAENVDDASTAAKKKKSKKK